MRAHLLERQPALVTEDDFIGTYESAQSSHVKHNLDFLAEHDILPLTYMNPKLPQINALIAWTMWAGCMQNNRCLLYDVPLEALVDLEEPLGIEFRRGKKKAVEFSPNNAYARIMSLLGVRQGKGTSDHPDGKVNELLQLPGYIRFLRDHKRQAHYEERDVSNKILIDYVQIMMHNKLYKARGIKFGLNLHASKDKFQSLFFANEVISLFNAIYPAIGLSDENIEYYHNPKQKSHHTKILFKREEILNGIAEYGLFDLSFRGHYHQYAERPDVTSGGAIFLNPPGTPEE